MITEDQEFQEYESFAKKMEAKYPKMFSGRYGGFATGKGWWPMLETLCGVIQSHIDHTNSQRERLLVKNEYDHPIPDAVQQVTVDQIKEKFGTLRFYYTGGDEFIHGAVWLAESLSGQICEECGAPGKTRSGGWVRTLCDTHEAEREAKAIAYARENGLEE